MGIPTSFDLFGGKLNIFRIPIGFAKQENMAESEDYSLMERKSTFIGGAVHSVPEQPPVMEIGVPDEDNDDSIDESEDDDTEDDDAEVDEEAYPETHDPTVSIDMPDTHSGLDLRQLKNYLMGEASKNFVVKHKRLRVATVWKGKIPEEIGQLLHATCETLKWSISKEFNDASSGFSGKVTVNFNGLTYTHEVTGTGIKEISSRRRLLAISGEENSFAC